MIRQVSRRRWSSTLGLAVGLLLSGASAAHALTISNVVITPTDHSITVTWTTNQPSNTGITYTSGICSGSGTIFESVTAHTETIFLPPESPCQFTVHSATSGGATASAGPFSSATLADVTAPAVLGMTLNSVTRGSAVVTVMGSEPTGSASMDYGMTLAYGQTATAQIGDQILDGRRNWIVLSGLNPDTAYQFQVRADDGYGNVSSPVGNFTLATDVLWDQLEFEPTARQYLQTCVAVGDAQGCTPSAGGSTAYRYTWPKEMSWSGNELLVHFNATADDLSQGNLVFEVGVKHVVFVNNKWVKLEVAGGTNPATLSTVNPGGVTLDRRGSYVITVPANLFAPGLNYLRLRGANITPQELGVGHVAPVAVWSRMRLRYASLTPPALTDDQLLDRTQALAARYFWDQAFKTNGFVRDLTNAPAASMAATGFGLAALAIMAERSGTSPEWTVTTQQARTRATKILQAAVNMQQQQAADSAHYGKAGFLYHFVEPDGRRYRNFPGNTPDSTIEVSTIDTALFAAGAVVAGQYFGGQVQTLADQLLANLNWSYFHDAPSGRFRHAWKPEYPGGTPIQGPDGDGYLSAQLWDRPTDEILLINLLALAREPSNSAFRASLYKWPRATRTYGGYNVVNSFFGSLFSYFFAEGFLDFEALGLDNPAGAGSSEPAANWFLNAKNAALANRQFAINSAGTYPTYSAQRWGMSACYPPHAPANELYFGENGAKPSECNFNVNNPPGQECGISPAPPQSGEPNHNGTVPPYGSISAMPLVRNAGETLGNNLAFQTLRHYYDAHYSGLWGVYGPRDSLVTRMQGAQPATTYSPLYVGIDVGPEVLLIERYRTGLPARVFMGHPGIDAAVRQQFSGYTNHPPVANAGVDQTLQVNTAATLNGCSSSDPDSQPLSFVWKTNGGQVLGTTCQVTAPAAASATSRTYRLAVSDAMTTVVDQVVVTWRAAPPKPTITITTPAIGAVVDRTQPIVVLGVATAPSGSFVTSVSFRVDDVTVNPPTNVVLRALLAIPSPQTYNWGSDIYANAAPGHKLRVTVTATGLTGTSNPVTLYINPDGSIPMCYILTAAYGSPYARDIQILNTFRERFIPMTWWHERYLRWYDAVGPRIARHVQRRPVLKAMVRALASTAAAIAQRKVDSAR